MNLYLARYATVHMRPPSLAEAIEADRLALTAAYQVANKKECSLGEALLEVADPKGELSVFLGPKNVVVPIKGEGKGKTRKSASDVLPRAGPLKMQKGDKPVVCRDWAAGKCTWGDRCKFKHA